MVSTTEPYYGVARFATVAIEPLVFLVAGDVADEPGRFPARAAQPGRTGGRDRDRDDGGRARRRRPAVDGDGGRGDDDGRERDDGRPAGQQQAPAPAVRERVGRGQRGRGRQRAVRRHLAVGPGVHAGLEDGQRGGDHIPGADPRGRGVRHMHAGARVRRAVRHVRRVRDRVRHRGRVPVAQVPGEARDAEDHGRPGAAPARHAATARRRRGATAGAGRGRRRRCRLHPKLAGRHHGAEQAARVQDGLRGPAGQAEQLIAPRHPVRAARVSNII